MNQAIRMYNFLNATLGLNEDPFEKAIGEALDTFKSVTLFVDKLKGVDRIREYLSDESFQQVIASKEPPFIGTLMFDDFSIGILIDADRDFGFVVLDFDEVTDPAERHKHLQRLFPSISKQMPEDVGELLALAEKLSQHRPVGNQS